ncbi:lamin tail domain-containing protein [Actinoplanes sp. CA-252034]|uniref:lamin tail domain-containing protein n=1 Tax=Actinoplanes sp. CA-252034 TaxID=3239906 RepID=UPI003D988A56
MFRTLPGVVTVALGSVLSVAAPVQAAPALRFQSVQYDSPGRDDRSGGSLNAEWIALVNTGPAAVRLNGWRIGDGIRTYTFQDVTIAGKGGVIYLHTGRGTDTATHRYWNSGNYVWNNTGDTATLRNRAGGVHDTCLWGRQSGRTSVIC